MRVRIAHKIINGLFTLLLLNAGLVTNVAVSTTSSTLPSKKQRSQSAHGDQESARTIDDRPLSPRLAALQDRLKSGDRDALDNFWKEISERGAPIIEPVVGSERDMLVTILWRAREETRNVFVFRLGDVSKPMARLLDTDLWYKTFRLQKGARFIYQFAANLPDPKEWRGITRFAGALRNDPLNPLQFAERWNEFNPYEVTFFSAVELPSAEPQIWNVARSTVPTGRVEREKFTSKLLGNERPIWIYTPHGYAAGKKPYGLLVLTDGGLYVNTARVATTLDNLIAAGLIPPLVAVMVDNPDRGRELSCNSAYADFLAQEIVPWARANYHATDRPGADNHRRREPGRVAGRLRRAQARGGFRQRAFPIGCFRVEAGWRKGVGMAEPAVRRQPASAFALLLRGRTVGRDLVVAFPCSTVTQWTALDRPYTARG